MAESSVSGRVSVHRVAEIKCTDIYGWHCTLESVWLMCALCRVDMFMTKFGHALMVFYFEEKKEAVVQCINT